MHILAFVLYFIISSIDAVTKGDWSGFEAMGKFLLYAGVIYPDGFSAPESSTIDNRDNSISCDSSLL